MESSYPWKYHFHCKSRLPNLLLLASLTDLPRYSYSSHGVFTCLAGAETWTPGGPSRQRAIDKKHYPEPLQPTIKTRINRPCARMPELPPFVRSDVSLFPLLFIVGRGGFFSVFFPPFPEKEILGYHSGTGLFIRVPTVLVDILSLAAHKKKNIPCPTEALNKSSKSDIVLRSIRAYRYQCQSHEHNLRLTFYLESRDFDAIGLHAAEAGHSDPKSPVS